MMCETTRQLHEDNERDNLYNLIQYIKYKIYYNLKLWRLSYRSLYTCNRYVARARHKGSPGAHLSSLTREQLTRARAQLTRPPAAPSGAGGDKRDGRPSGNVPANIIRSRDTRILIRVGGVSHDSATLCQSSVYAAAFSCFYDREGRSEGANSRGSVILVFLRETVIRSLVLIASRQDGMWVFCSEIPRS